MSSRARKLRRLASDAENKLWRYLRNRQLGGYKFRRQAPVGRYIVDFVCVQAKLIIEADGGQHLEQVNYDKRRTTFLIARGFEVLRYWNDDILRDTDRVLEDILYQLEKRPSPRPSPGGRGG